MQKNQQTITKEPYSIFVKEGSINVTYKDDNKISVKTILKDQVGFDRAKEAVNQKDWETLYNLLNVTQFISSHPDLEIKDDHILYKGNRVDFPISKVLIERVKSGEDVSSWINFVVKLLQNPSNNSVESLYKWIETVGLTLTSEGNFVAYKGVDKNYYSIHSGSITLIQGQEKDGKILNSVGSVIEVPRNEVDDTLSNQCSHGLHVGSYKYADSFRAGGVLLVVEVSPADVVAVPHYDSEKIRVSKYIVVGEVDV